VRSKCVRTRGGLSAVLWGNRVPPVVGGYPVVGVLGCALSVALGLRLLTKIWRE